MSINNQNTVGYTVDTPKHLLLNSGAIYTNYGLIDEKLFGAVAPGNEFNCTVKTYQVKVSGITNSNVKGCTILVDIAVSLKVDLLEMTTETLSASLMGSVVDTLSNPDYDIITLPMPGSGLGGITYYDNIALVSTLSGSDRPVVILLKNALATGGIKIKVDDAKDNSIPVTFEAFSDPLKAKESPFEIHYPKFAVTTIPFDIEETPVVDNGKILLTFNDTVAPTVFVDGFSATVDNLVDYVTTAVRGVNSCNTILLTLTTAPVAGQAVTVAYTQPAVGVQTTSLSLVPLDTFTELTVMNN